jgi:L-ascorbate metabolism protein UlaG (beta-lactamase superfamily)
LFIFHTFSLNWVAWLVVIKGVEWFMGQIHMTPEQAVEASRILGAGTTIAIHFGTFPMSDDGEMEPTDRLSRFLNDIRRPNRPAS